MQLDVDHNHHTDCNEKPPQKRRQVTQPLRNDSQHLHHFHSDVLGTSTLPPFTVNPMPLEDPQTSPAPPTLFLFSSSMISTELASRRMRMVASVLMMWMVEIIQKMRTGRWWKHERGHKLVI